ncbi:MAG: hypothetical protein IKN41_04800 [Candidatus Methanomethylophilaceae archaeon]|nr:hypothetical protein [Candidatus Methanomethylophilaceae archaeon]
MSTIENVRIYTDSNLSTYIDVTCRLARRCRIHEVENYGATAEFTIVNDLYSSSYNVLSSSFYRLHNPSTGGYSRWSDNGTRAITTGMFVQIRDGSSSGSCWGTFMITGISASDDLVTFTCGDYIQLLRATGAEYYRNHYVSGGQRTVRKVGELYTSGSSYVVLIDRPRDVTLVGGAAGDVLYMAPNDWQTGDTSGTAMSANQQSGRTNSDPAVVISRINLGGSGATNRTEGIVAIRSITIPFTSLSSVSNCDSWIQRVTVNVYTGYGTNGTLIGSVTTAIAANGQTTNVTVDFGHYVDLSAYTYITIEAKGSVTGFWSTSQSSYSFNFGAITAYREYYDSGAYTTLESTSSGYWNNYAICFEADALKYGQASGTNITYNGSYFFQINSVSGATSIDSTFADQMQDVSGNVVGRALITYQDPESNMNKMTIAANILLASGAVCDAVWSDKEVNMFRCGGDCYHNYLLALMDMEDSEGDMHAMAAVPTSWAHVWIGKRYKASDSYQKTLYYAGGSTYTGIAMKSFSPHITKSGRPALAVAKGKRNDGTPIIVAVKDPNIAIGSSVSVLGSSESSSVDAAFNAYSQIITNRSTDWEGEVVLSGIYMDFFSRSGNNVGGIPVRIYDSRYGMSAYRAKVKECTVDYQELTTTLVLNNYSELYSNAVLDTSKMAYEAGNMSAVATAVELYTRQYVFVDSGQSLPSTSTYTMSIQLTTGDTMTVEADVIKYPELGVATVIGYFPEGSPYTSSQYAVYRVRVNSGSWILIDSHMRPDKHLAQYVIVNVQMNL